MTEEIKEDVVISEQPEAETTATEEDVASEGPIIDIFKKLLGWNYHEYGTKKEML